MNTLLHISQTFALVALVTLSWLTLHAFKKHSLWGIAVLLLSPFSALCFAIKYWKDEKKPFLTYVASFGTAASLALYVFTTWGGWEAPHTALTVHQGVQKQNLSRQLAPKQVDTIAQTTQAARDAVPAHSRHTLSRRPSALKVNYRADYREIDIADAKKYIGKSFKVTRRNSEERECRLIGSSPGKLLFEQRGRGGTFTFEYRHRDIVKLKLLASMDYPDSHVQVTMK